MSRFGVGLLLGLTVSAPTWGADVNVLSFEDRVACQEAIEQVYWKHRAWPDTNPGPKPALSSLLSEEALRQKVEKTILLSSALDSFWDRPVTSAELQAELRRIQRQTRSPSMLREISTALGDSPYLLAECLARPVLTNRLARSFYAWDDRIHAEREQRANAALAGLVRVDHLAAIGDAYAELTWVRSASERTEIRVPGEEPDAIPLTPERWTQKMDELSELLGSTGERLPLAEVSELVEDEDRFYAVTILELGADRVRAGIVEWRKQPFEPWLEAGRAAPNLELRTDPRDYDSFVLPPSPDAVTGGTGADSWTPTAALPEAVSGFTAVWTGTEMIVWGGGRRNTGARYDPTTDSWTGIAAIGAPLPRKDHVAVWTGTEMIVWGGCGQSSDFCELSSGGRYDPSTDSWAQTSPIDAPGARRWHTGIWTGTEMIVFGGCRTGSFGNNACEIYLTGTGRYNPTTNSWTLASTVGEPEERLFHTAVWTGTEMIVWGGFPGLGVTNTGGRYNPATDSWTSTTNVGAPSPRSDHTAVWTDGEMIIWGGCDNVICAVNDLPLGSGGRYDPSTNSWTSTTTTGAPDPRTQHTAVWTGTEMIVWGGQGADLLDRDTGGRYDPAADVWTPTNLVNAPGARAEHGAIWTGAEMIVWGQLDSQDLKSGGRYDPDSDSWVPTSVNDPRRGRENHLAVWTGTEMLIWGGDFLPGNSAPGERYDVVTDSWSLMNAAGAPFNKEHGASTVWTGTEMIVWGGQTGTVAFNSGGRYNPTTDSWQPTNTHDAPVVRAYAATIWTGTEMIVWGGSVYFDQTGEGFQTSTGGRYDPVRDGWVPTNTSGAPQARGLTSGVWTGSEMIVWGGYGDFQDLSTGGKYDPSADSWSPMTNIDAPSPRHYHTALWSGSRVLIWGGAEGSSSSPNYLNTGALYDPSTDAWSPVNSTDAPAARIYHASVWTGTEMIVWGGCSGPSSNCGTGHFTGGRYDPATDGWTATSIASAPSARDSHTGIWTGTEMVVWSGYADDYGSYTTTGGRYSPYGALGPPSEVSPPGSLQPLVFTSRAVLQWESAATSGSVSFNLYRGDVASLASVTNTSCYEPDLPTHTTTEMMDPGVGSGWYYLVTGENAAGEGPMGGDSEGTARNAVAQCP